ncbi:MAG: hypothetical protein ABIO67_11340, partial [Mycobacteriales bacterium]
GRAEPVRRARGSGGRGGLGGSEDFSGEGGTVTEELTGLLSGQRGALLVAGALAVGTRAALDTVRR